MCAASEFLNSRTGQWLREKCSLSGPESLEGRRKTNPVVDGQLMPRTYKTKKRRRDEPAATPSQRARRPRRAVNYDDSEPDDDDEGDLELGPPDDDDGWD